MNNKNQMKVRAEIEDYLIHEFGHYLESVGAKAIMGRIWGLLLARGEPVSLKELAEKLQVSKAAASNNAKIGTYLGVFRKRHNPEFPRENFFDIGLVDSMEMIIDPGLKKLASLIEKFDKAIKKIEESEIELENSKELNDMYVRLYHMKALFEITLEEYHVFGERIRKRIKELKKSHP